MEQKLVVCIMGQDCEKFIPMCLNSVKDADAIVYCSGGEVLNKNGKMVKVTDAGAQKFSLICEKDRDLHKKVSAIFNKYDQDDLNMNGKQRNFYLNYLKENYKGWFALCLDADEVVEDLQEVRNFINQLPEQNHDILFSPKMRHFIGNLGHEDATRPIHFVPHRLFKIRDELVYPEREHPVLCGEQDTQYANIPAITIWHLSHIDEAFNVKKKYENHMNKSQMHSKENLRNWYILHLFGMFPISPVNMIDIPAVILNEFGFEKDEIYFMKRDLELKHFQDAIHWKEYFKCKSAYVYGCGKGPRVYALNQIGVDTVGYDISKFAIKHKLDYPIFERDVREENSFLKRDLVIAYDLLEHIDYEDLDKAIDNLIISSKKYILISIPFKGNPNLEADPTHIIKESRAWWIEKFASHGLELIKTPEHFLFKEQVMIFEK